MKVEKHLKIDGTMRNANLQDENSRKHEKSG